MVTWIASTGAFLTKSTVALVVAFSIAYVVAVLVRKFGHTNTNADMSSRRKKSRKKNRHKTTTKHKLRSPSDLLDVLPKKYLNKGCFKYMQGFLWFNNTVEGAVALTNFLKRRHTYGEQCFSNDINTLIQSENAMTTAMNILRFHTTMRTRCQTANDAFTTLINGATPIARTMSDAVLPIHQRMKDLQLQRDENLLFPNALSARFRPEYFPIFLATVWSMSCRGFRSDQSVQICDELSTQLEKFTPEDFENCTVQHVMELATGPPPTHSDIQYFLGVLGVRVCKRLNRTHPTQGDWIARLMVYAQMEIEARPDEAEGYIDLGVGQMRSGDLSGAKLSLQRAVDLASSAESEDDVALGIAAIELAGVLCLGSGHGTVCNGEVKKIWKIASDAMSRCDRWGMKIFVIGESSMSVYVDEHLHNSKCLDDAVYYPINQDDVPDMRLDRGQSLKGAKRAGKGVKGALVCDVCGMEESVGGSRGGSTKAFKKCGTLKSVCCCCTRQFFFICGEGFLITNDFLFDVGACVYSLLCSSYQVVVRNERIALRYVKRRIGVKMATRKIVVNTRR